MTDTENLPEILANTPFFSPLGKQDLADIAEQMQLVTWKPKQLIFMRGDKSGNLYLVLSGRVRLSVVSNEGRELSLLLAREGDLFGEIAVLDDGARTTDATAITAVRAMSLSREAFQKLVEARNTIACASIKFLCARLRSTNETLEAVAIYPIEVRLARFFLSQLRLAEADPDQTSDQGPSLLVNLGMSQSELGFLLGASRPKINIALKALMKSGAIEKQGTDFVCHRELLMETALAE